MCAWASLSVTLRTKGVRLVRGDPPLSEFRTQFSIAGVPPSPRHVHDRTGETLAISPATRQSQPKGLVNATVCTLAKSGEAGDFWHEVGGPRQRRDLVGHLGGDPGQPRVGEQPVDQLR